MKMNKTYRIVEVVLIVLALLFTAIGCEKELTKSTELKEPTEQTQLLDGTSLAGAEAEELGVIIERNLPVPIRDTASRPYAVVVDANTLEHPEWGQVVEALKKKYNAKVFVAHYPEVGTVRKALNEYMPWYVCFVAQPEQATREMITAAAHTMTWLDDDPYEDAIWAVLTGFVAEDALRIINAEPLVVRKELSNMWDNWLDWLEVGVSLGSDSDYKFIKNSDGVKQQLEGPKERTPEFVKVLNQDDCDIITTSAHATEHVFYLGSPDTASDGYITHNDKGDIYGIDTLGEVHHVNAKKPKIYYSPGNCLIGHIDGQSCLSLAWIHNGVNAFFGHLYNQAQPCYAWAIAEYFMALQGQYTFAEATYANWLALRFSVDEQLEAYLCCDRGGKGTVLYGDPAWEARVKHTTVPAYTQDLNIEHLSDGLIKMTVSVTINSEWKVWVPKVRPIILLPFRIKEARIKNTDLDKVGVADNFIVLDLDTPLIGGSDLPVGTKKSVVLHARKLEVWPFLTDNEVITRVKERKLDNISRCIDFLTDETVDPNERIKKAAMWNRLFPTSEIPVASYEKKTELLNLKDKDGRTLLHLAVGSADGDIVKLLLDKGADINAKDDESGFTALHYAAQFGNKNAAELLIARDADINAKDKQGHTPLYVAVNHDYKVAEFLMNKGADSSIRTESGRTLLQLAQQRRQTESKVPDLIFDGVPNSGFGLRMVCGDVDGDGYDDILIEGHNRVYLFYGGPDMDTTADLILEGQNEGDPFGGGIACGDINNDGYEDIIIGASAYKQR
ncbi:ankyrin repeat domain-containing protein, partial [Planctomycetota bacterium]